ncbi:TonB-dependent receptor domain-containing protein [Adhaeribacter soli]|uniref:TonB-dependent receptor n=2 Tax=Adhaeribacter soli TaxID=2607655 RepID=A0A5N1IQV0_9BACT|nr:outer membrane beta-barrel family protein [Adhaeribacter soli]KAA9331905.1 TonB-dependent receptor [Adhaeribacter soli]
MKKIYLLFLTLCAFCSVTHGQTDSAKGIIRGIVTDSASNTALDYVSISLKESGKTEILRSTYTNEKGEFSFSGLILKPYEVLISYVGYQPKTIKVESLSATRPTVNLPKIKLQPSTKQLQEVEVTSQKILVTQDIDKISYDVEADPESKSNTVLDMLRKVPMVTVDADDNIKLKGNSNYKVLINGKASALFARNPKDVLKSMPASSIKKIEVITSPPAKYEAEGIGGIINIITNKDTPGGYNGSVNVGARTPTGFNAGAYLTVKTGKFGASANYGTNSWTSPRNTNNFIRQDLLRNTQFTQTGEGKNTGGNHYGGLQLSYELDSLNLFTGNATLYDGDNDIQMNQQALLESGTTTLQQYLRTNDRNEYWNGHEVGLDYQRGFRRNKEQLLTLSYKFSRNGYGNQVDFTYEPLLNYQKLKGRTDNASNEREHTVQADYVQPFGENNLEVGLKSITRLNDSKYFYDTLNHASGQFINDPKQTNNFDYHQDIYAAYASVTLKKNDWGLKLGSRLEETRINANFSSSETSAQQDYLNLIPSIALSRKLKEMQDLKLSYNQRIERPGLWFLNPYVNRIDVKNISYGNPDLDATTSHNFELAHSTFVKNSSFNTSASYTFTNNSIQQFTTIYPDSAVTTYGNLGREQNLGFSVNTNLNLTDKLNLNLNTSLNYVILNGFLQDKPVQNEGFTAGIFGYGSYKFEKKWRLSANMGYYSRSITLQGRNGGYYFNSLTLTKTFLKDDKATASLWVQSPFQKFRRWESELNDPAFTQTQKGAFQLRRIGISFSYKFGKLKGGIASKKRGIQNDDVKGGKSGGGS